MPERTKELYLGWSIEEINKLELTFLHAIFECKHSLGVDASLTFAKYIGEIVKVNSDNYPIFMKTLQIGNHWVVDALLGDNDPETFFNRIQPNHFFISECFKILTDWKKGSIYPKCLSVVFGLLKVAYENPLEGYRLYPLTIPDVNNLGKHLDDTQDQTFTNNRIILNILDKIASLVDPGIPVTDSKILEVATQANNIRGKFLDITKKLNEAIPDILLQKSDYKKQEVPPSRASKKE